MSDERRHVLVVGGGIAGVAAAWAAQRAGARVTLLHGSAGASALYSGALDFGAKPSERVVSELAHFATALGCWTYGGGPYRIATETGLCRSVDGRDSALLDLEPLAGSRIGVIGALHSSWDAPLVARQLGASSWAQQTSTEFVVLPAPDLLATDELAVPLYDLATRFDAPKRLQQLCAVLEKARGDVSALLLGPWLGLATDVAQQATQTLGIPVGESTSAPGGVAGARFERARDRLLQASAIEARTGPVQRVSAESGGFSVGFGSEDISAEAVVLAIGGVAAGGILLDDARPEHPGGACFHASLQAPVTLELDGKPVERVSTLHGVDFCLAGLGTLERVGIAERQGKTKEPGLFVAGDCAAGAPRSALQAARAGIRAGALAAARPD